MYEIDGAYSDYYREIDPKKRRIILGTLPENDFVRELYDDRYSDHDGKGRENIDWWLWRCICLQILYGRGSFFRRFRDREISAVLHELRMHDNDGAHSAFLYHEYRNVCRRYLSTCSSGSYASRFMGFRQASDEEKVLRACADIWQMSGGIARKSGNTGAMKLWIEAFHDELMDYADICRDEYERLSREE